jgi:hypothetical protein
LSVHNSPIGSDRLSKKIVLQFYRCRLKWDVRAETCSEPSLAFGSREIGYIQGGQKTGIVSHLAPLSESVLPQAMSGSLGKQS